MRVGAVLCFAALLARPLAAQGVEARTAHFRVVTAGPAERATAAAAHLERVRAEFAALGFAVPASLTEVIVFDDLAETRRYVPGGSAGLFQQGTDAAFLAVVWRAGGAPLESLAHEFAHQVLLGVAPVRQQPRWLREGLADLLSNFEPVPGGLKIGLPIAGHIQALKRSSLAGQPETEDGPLFYAESWLRAHQLIVGKPFSGMLTQRIAALDPPSRPFDAKLPDPLPSEILPAATGPDGAPPTVRPLEAWEYEHRLAELLRAAGRMAEARVTLASLRVRFPARPEPAESLGALEMDAFHYDRAADWLARAVRLGSENPVTCYRYSLLLMRPGGAAEQAERYARRAVELDPGRPLSWLAQAQAQMQLSHWDAARASLAEMRARTTDPVLAEQVRIELAEIDRRREQQTRPPLKPAPPAKVTVAAAQPDTAPAPLPPPASTSATRPSAARPRAAGWPPPGTLLFWGYVRGVECGNGQKILTVGNARFSVRVRERAGAPARLYSPPAKWKRLPCSLKGAEVNVVYRPLAGFGPGSVNGDLVAVVF